MHHEIVFLFQTYILKLLDNQLKKIKWEDTGSHLEKLVALLTFMHIACIFKPPRFIFCYIT